jgi:hypothetical protein
MARTHTKLLAKLGAALIIVLLVLLSLTWWKLPQVLNAIAEQQLEQRGYAESFVRISKANTQSLSIQSATINGAGWSVQLEDSFVNYNLSRVVKEQTVNSVTLDRLFVQVTPEQLEASEDPLTVETLTTIPAQRIEVKEGHFQLVQTTGLTDVYWSGSINTEDDSLVFAANRLQAVATSQDGGVIMNMEPLLNPSGLLLFSLAKDGSQAGLAMNLSGIHATGPDWKLEEVTVSSQLGFADINLDGIDLLSPQTLLPKIMDSIEGELSILANQISYGSLNLQWSSGSLSFESQDAPGTISAEVVLACGIATFGNETLEQLDIRCATVGNLNQLQSTADIKFLLDGATGAITVTQRVEDPLDDLALEGNYILEPFSFRYSDIIGRHIPSLKDLSFSGNISAEGAYTYNLGEADATATIRLENSFATLPSKKLSATGIRAVLDFESLNQITSTSNASFLAIETTTLGDLEFSNTHLRFDLVEGNRLKILEGQTEIFKGLLKLDPSTLTRDPLSLDTAIHFERLSLAEIADNMAFFDGSMEGAISGFLPLGYRKKKFLSGEGFLALTDNQPARLRYKTKGLLRRDPPKESGLVERLTNRIIGQLKLAPEKLVEDALSDMIVTELRVDLLSSDTPETPVRIRLSGEGMSGKTVVPMRLDTNINGTLEELFEFLVRINTIGSGSL